MMGMPAITGSYGTPMMMHGLSLVRKVHERPTSTMTGLVMKEHLGHPTEREVLGGVVKVHPMKVGDINLLPVKETHEAKPKMPKVEKCDSPRPKTKGMYGMVDVRSI
jgi:hypothetical protein